jgi:hypothetical protein
MIYRLACILFLVAWAGGTGLSQDTPKSFVLDQSKEYVYIAFDHVGDRKPVFLGELKKGLWLRLVNNCRLPIIVNTFGTGTDDPGIGLFHEVVLSGMWLDARSGHFTRPPHNLKLPHGYRMDTSTGTVIQPGKDLLFSVPIDHVNVNWYLRVRFDLDVVTPSKQGSDVLSYVDFDWWRIPEQFQKSIAADMATTPRGKANEGGHPYAF